MAKLLNYTTIIDAEQTISEIQRMLSSHGVLSMLTDYDGPHVSAVSFKINSEGDIRGYRLPCNWRAVRQLFKEQGITSVKHKDKDLDKQAIRTAWRVIKDWTEAQLALVEIGMVTIPQIFLPYTITKNGQTIAERMESDPKFLLGDGK